MSLFNPVILALLAAVCAGALLAVQAPINATLARATGDPVSAACLNFLVGFLVLAVIWAFRGTPLPKGLFSNTPVWVWVGGTMGAFYISVLIWSVPIIGAFTVTAGVVFGQLVAALLLDRYGAIGLPVQEITWPRLAGLGLVMAGLFMSRL
ncbi:DMT family transporter [Pelagibacterium montanilacus]|uniref:DMT family transporter n=1 Tax=Pelagibacterium montanilacus TaxID=2185280 RepID=UPI000F8F6EED|nr:DMT family transporter [Pelagibacterium montanilacus]